MIKLSTLVALVGIAVAASTSNAFAVAAWPTYDAMPATSECRNDLGFQRTFRTTEISAMHNQSVFLISVCEDLTMASRNDYGSLFVDGNADGLRSPIAQNDLLMTALYAQDYDQNDVVSIRLGANDSVILYVHQRDMR